MPFLTCITKKILNTRNLKAKRNLVSRIKFFLVNRTFSLHFRFLILHFSAPTEDPPKEEYKPETDSYKPEYDYERDESYKNEYEEKPKYGHHGHHGYGQRDDSYMKGYEGKPRYGHYRQRHGYGHKKSYGKC